MTLYYQVSKSLDDMGQSNRLFGEATFESEAKELIAEFLWKKLKTYSLDLEAFAQHAKRSTINVEDVKLLFRRNTHLLEKISLIEEEIKTAEETKPERVPSKRKRIAKELQPVDEESNQ